MIDFIVSISCFFYHFGDIKSIKATLQMGQYLCFLQQVESCPAGLLGKAGTSCCFLMEECCRCHFNQNASWIQLEGYCERNLAVMPCNLSKWIPDLASIWYPDSFKYTQSRAGHHPINRRSALSCAA